MGTKVYIVGRCPRCGVPFRKRVWGMKSDNPDCGRHEADKKRELYDEKRALGICVWSGCNKRSVLGKSMCKGHLTDNRVAAAERKRRAKVQKLQQELRARGV